MSQHGTALRVTPSIEREFHSAVIAQLPDLTDEEMQRHNRSKGELGRLLREALTPDGKTAGNVFRIACEGSYMTSELVARGKYDWSNNWITDERFPIQKHEPVSRTIELVKFDHDPTSEEVLAEFSRRGLERPTHEDALYFGIEHPDEQMKRPLVFLHEPVQGPGGRLGVLVLDGHVGGRNLRLDWFGSGWPRDDLFAGVRK